MVINFEWFYLEMQRSEKKVECLSQTVLLTIYLSLKVSVLILLQSGVIRVHLDFAEFGRFILNIDLNLK